MFAASAGFRGACARNRRHAWQRVCALGVALCVLAVPRALAARIVVVASADTPAFAQAVAGMRGNADWSVETHDAGEPPALLAPMLADVAPGTAIVALGRAAARALAQWPLSAPVVDCMVAGDFTAPANAVVVPLAVPIDAHVRWLRRLVPAARKVAIVYDPAENAMTAATAARELSAAGYDVLTEGAHTPAELPVALSKLGDADVLLAIPDTTIFVPPLAKGLLLFTYRTQTPMIAFSDAWVRAGALYALEWDYAELGRYCGALALGRASGTVDSALRPPMPHVSVNRRAAQQLRLKWDSAALAGVSNVHD
jgi:putative tryptophan/tyrosine transport system substrate-binding protein